MEQINYYNDNLPPKLPFLSPKKWYQRGWGIFIILLTIIVLTFLTAGILLFFDLLINPETNQNQNLSVDNSDLLNQLGSDLKSSARQLAEKMSRPLFGNNQARLVIVEFSDFQCPVCTQEFPVIREIMAKYQDSLLYIYRHFPSIDQNSIIIAQASLCANEQGKFWPMHDRLFLNKNEVFSQDWLRNVAQQSGLDLQQFDNCLQSEKYRDQVIEDTQDAIDLGVQGTPTFFVNGNLIAGAVTLEQWEQIIEKGLELLK